MAQKRKAGRKKKIESRGGGGSRNRIFSFCAEIRQGEMAERRARLQTKDRVRRKWDKSSSDNSKRSSWSPTVKQKKDERLAGESSDRSHFEVVLIF